MYATRISENKIRLESNHGPVGTSPGLNRLIAKLKRRGAIITRTGHSGLVIITGTPKMAIQWQKEFPLNERCEC